MRFEVQDTVDTDLWMDISEKQLEDFFIAYAHMKTGIRPIARQIKLDCGIADVLCRAGKGLYFVVELKAVPLADKDLAQVLAYTCEFRARHPQYRFVPLLIGPRFGATYLQHVLQPFCSYNGVVAPHVALYSLYDFSAHEGLEFRRRNRPQIDSQLKRADHLTSAKDKADAFGNSYLPDLRGPLSMPYGVAE